MINKINKGFIINLKQLIIEVLSFEKPTDKLLSFYFKNNPKIGAIDRHIIAETIYAILRNYFKLKYYLNKALLDNAILYTWHYILNLDNKYLEYFDYINLQDIKPNDNIESKLELPLWLIEELRKDYDEEVLAKIALSMQKIAPLDIRVNILKTSMKQVVEYLVANNIKYQPTKISPYGIRLHDKNFIIKNKLFLDGWFEVQDESSQIAAMLLGPKRGDMIVDFCAGSGGKTLAIGMLMRNSGRIYAFDINEKRLNNLSPRLKKSGLSNVYPSLINNENDIKIKRLHNKIDRVLVDAPCSGLGTLRRNPDLKFRQSRDSISSLNQQQLSILTSASKLLKVNGILGYATCSILRCENQDIINKFLENNKNFVLLDYKDFIDNIYLNANNNYLQLLPHIHDTDGFFIALLKRVS